MKPLSLLPVRKKRSPVPMGMIGPDAIEVQPRRLRAGGVWSETFVVVGYPREVSPGWLSPLLSYPGPADVALHVEPVRNDIGVAKVRRQLARFESSRRIEAEKGGLANPELEAVATDAEELMASIVKGEGRLFRVGLYLTVRSDSLESLRVEVNKIRSQCASMLMDLRPVTFRSFQGWLTTLPLATDAIRMRRTFDSRALATTFPFASAEIENSAGGIFIGRNGRTGGMIFMDPFSLQNHNQVILASSGAGKSYATKIQILRHLYDGVDVLVLDPEDEYRRLAEAVGGTVIQLPGANRINPLDLSGAGTAGALMDQALFVHTFVSSLLGGLSSQDKAALDKAILSAYLGAGVTEDPRTHVRPAPLLADVRACLEKQGNGDLAIRLHPFTGGSHSALFNQHTTVRPQSHLVVFCLKQLPDELRLPGTLLALDAIWKEVSKGERKRRLVVVDEGWRLLGLEGKINENKVGAGWLQLIVKSARKHLAGLVFVSQDVADPLRSDLGRSIVTNSASQLLLRQSSEALDELGVAFHLSEGEKTYLVGCDVGEGLLCVGNERVAIRIEADTEFEHALCNTSGPAEIGDSAGKVSV